MTRKKVSTATKTGTVSGAVVGVGAYAALWLQQKYGVPAELSAPVLGAAGAVLGAWAGKLMPH